MIVFRDFISLEYIGQLCVESIYIQLLQAIGVRKVDLVNQPLVPHKLFLLERVEQLLQIDVELISTSLLH